MRRGLIIGTFLVPHRGHHRLISLASTMVQHLDVLVLASDDDPIIAQERTDWLREHLSKRARFQVVSRHLPAGIETAETADIRAAWRNGILDHLSGKVPDIVFGRSPRDIAVASLFGAQFCIPDEDLPAINASGRNLYGNPLSSWDDILPAARPLFARRIAVAGGNRASRNGTAFRLAQKMETAFVPDRGATQDIHYRAPFEQMIARSSTRAYIVAEDNPDEAPARLADHAFILPGERAAELANRYRTAGAIVTELDDPDDIDTLAAIVVSNYPTRHDTGQKSLCI